MERATISTPSVVAAARALAAAAGVVYFDALVTRPRFVLDREVEGDLVTPDGPRQPTIWTHSTIILPGGTAGVEDCVTIARGGEHRVTVLLLDGRCVSMSATAFDAAARLQARPPVCERHERRETDDDPAGDVIQACSVCCRWIRYPLRTLEYPRRVRVGAVETWDTDAHYSRPRAA